MNYKEQIFKILDIEPNEEFKISSDQKQLYRLNDDLMLQYKINSFWIISGIFSVVDILRGKISIIKTIKFTEQEQLAIDYAKASGYKWFAKEKDRTIIMFDKKPVRGERHWFKDNFNDKANILEIPLSFIEWEDEPYYIGD